MGLLCCKHHLAFTALCTLLLSGCNAESSSVIHSFSSGNQISCNSEDKGSAEFWDCDENKKLRFSTHVEASGLSIKLSDGEFFLSRDLGHLDDPEFEDMLIVSDSLPYLVEMVCSGDPNLELTVLTDRLDVGSSRFQVKLPVRRSINEDPNVYEWSVKARDVYRSLNQYCLRGELF